MSDPEEQKNREEYCGRIGGNVYMRKDKPCPECGVSDTHVLTSQLREENERLTKQNKCLAKQVDDLKLTVADGISYESSSCRAEFSSDCTTIDVYDCNGIYVGDLYVGDEYNLQGLRDQELVDVQILLRNLEAPWKAQNERLATRAAELERACSDASAGIYFCKEQHSNRYTVCSCLNGADQLLGDVLDTQIQQRLKTIKKRDQ